MTQANPIELARLKNRNEINQGGAINDWFEKTNECFPEREEI